MPRVAVILAAYNAERYIVSAVRSVLAQTFTDFELVIVDDGSTDNTLSLLRDIESSDPRVRVISRANTGQTQAAIDGINASTAPLIARMDADDLCKPDRLAKQVAAFDADPDLVLLGGAYDLIDPKGRLLTTVKQPLDNDTLQKICLTGRTPICQPLAMFRREAYDRAGGYDPQIHNAEDLDLWLRLGEVGKIACLPDVLLQYRQHSGSISESRQREQIENQKCILLAAWKRRRLSGEPTIDTTEWRATGDRTSQYQQLTRYGWWAWHAGQNRTALIYGLKAVASSPIRREGWKITLTALLRTSPRARKSID